MPHVYDFIGIGLGPFNLGLAALTAPHTQINAVFFEQREKFNWHPGMMLDDVTLQTPFMSDLVTLADPTSEYSFLNYAKQHNKLYAFYIREDFFLLRKEYNQYCQWVSQSLENIRFKHTVTQVTFDEARQYYQVQVTNGADSTVYYARHIVLGTGPQPFLPECARQPNPRVLHSSAYLSRKAELLEAKRITLVGGGQSAAEIYYDLIQQQGDSGPHIDWITSSPRYFPLEYTKLTLEMTSPEYVDYFYQLPQSTRDGLNKSQKNLYKGINSDLINKIYDLLYQRSLDTPARTRLKTHSRLVALDNRRQHRDIRLTFHHTELDQHYRLHSDYVVMATGFHYQMPGFLTPLKEHLTFDKLGRYAVNRHYAIDRAGQRVFVQNAEQHTHGFVSPDLGMACYRNSIILNTIAGYEVYPVEQRIAFQTFDLDDVECVSHKEDAA